MPTAIHYFSVAALTVFLCALPPYSAAADSLSLKSGQLEKLRASIQVLRHDLEVEQGKKDDLRTQLRDIEEQIGRLSIAFKRTGEELRRQSRKLDELTAEQRRHGRELARQRDMLAQQVRAAFAVGRQGYLKLLLEQQDPAAVSRNLIYYDYFNRARAQRIAAVNTEMERLATVKAAIAQQVQTLDQLRTRQEQERDSLQGKYQARGVVLAAVNARIESKDQELARLLDNERQLQAVVERLRQALADIPDTAGGAPFGRLKGKLHWPAQGQIIARFGAPRSLGKLKWQGVMIDAGQGADVHAVYHGRVAFADWLRGYGLLVIVDHGDGYMSLYGHNESIYKQVGDWVETGEVIASVGSSGGRERPGLYFEIRHNGTPSNPVLWCKN
jgi:septal ring factor EnvC (AmiA/AmiB activator)